MMKKLLVVLLSLLATPALAQISFPGGVSDPGPGGGASGTVNTGTGNQIGYYASNGSAISGNANATLTAPGVLSVTGLHDAGFSVDSNGNVSALSANLSTGLAAVPTTLINSVPVVSSNVITSDNLATGSFILGHETRYIFGGSTTTGGRIAEYNFIANTATTNSANTNRNYVATTSIAYTAVGDGGTNTTSGAKGAFFGINPIVQLDPGATNVFEASDEFDTFTATGSSARYLRGISIVGFNNVRGTQIDAALTISGSAQGTFSHIGWTTGILFTDANSVNPFYSGSSLMSSYWQGATPTILNGIDLSGFTITGSAFKAIGFVVDGSGNVTGTAFNSGLFGTFGSSDVIFFTNSIEKARIVASTGDLQINNHIRANGSAPTPTACGTGSPSVIGDDKAGLITMGTGSPTGCVITFAVAYTSAPYCTVSWQATPLASQSYAISNTAITLTQTGTSSNKVNYTCFAQSGG